MDEPIAITRAEYEAKFGSPVVAAETPIPITRAEFAAKFNNSSTPSLWKDPIDALTSSDWWFTRGDGTKVSGAQSVLGPVMSVGNALTFGGFDEGISGVQAFIDALSRDVSIGDAYDQRLKELRGYDKNFDKAAPVVSTALDIAGALRMPIKSGIGERTKVIPKAIQAGKEGLGLGALYGFGSGEGGLKARAEEALKVGAVGGAFGLAATPLLEGGVRGAQWIADAAAERGITPQKVIDDLAEALFSSSAESQRGSISNRPIEGGFTPAELAVAKQLKNAPASKVQAAVEEMQSAVRDDIPLFLPEAVESPKVYRNARFIANNDASMEMAGRAIADRAESAIARGNNALDRLSGESDTFSGASRFVAAADDIITAAERKREEIARPLYGAAYSEMPAINNPALDELLSKDKVLQKAINSVKQTANNADLPENSTELLIKARSEIGNLIESAKAQGLGRKAMDLTDTYRRLNNILHDGNANPLKEADAAYQAASQQIEALNDTFLSNLQRISPDKIQNVGQMFNLPAKRIQDLRATFQAAGKDAEWRAGVRSFLQNSIESTTDGRNYTLKLTGNTVAREKLQAALGDSYDEILRRLELEDRMFKGKNLYNPQSGTEGNIQERKAFEGETVGFVQNLIKKNWEKTIGSLFSDDVPDELAQAIGEIYFNPSRGAETLERIQPLLEAYGKNKSVADVISALGGVTTSRGYPAFREFAKSPSATDRRSALGNDLELGQTIKSQAAPAEPGREVRSSKAATPAEPQKNQSTAEAGFSETEQAPDKNFRQTYSDKDNLFNDLFQTAEMGDDMRSVKQVEAEIDKDPYLSALYETESGRNPKAKNPKSSASGGFQFINRTAKALGVSDPFDLDQSLAAVRRLTDEHRKLFGDDPAVLYSAHYLGSPLLRKVQRGAPLTAREQDIVDSLVNSALPRFVRIYTKVSGPKTKPSRQVKA